MKFPYRSIPWMDGHSQKRTWNIPLLIYWFFEQSCLLTFWSLILVYACVCMYVCVYVVCIYICVCVCVCICVCILKSDSCVCMCVYVCMSVCVYIYVCMYVYMCVYVCVYVYICVCMCSIIFFTMMIVCIRKMLKHQESPKLQVFFTSTCQ